MMMTNSSLPERHITMLGFPFTSHASLTLGLIRRLATAALDVTFSFYSTTKSIQYLLSSSPILDNIKPCPVLDRYVFSENMKDIEVFLKVGKECFKRAMKAAEEETGRMISCVMADALVWFSGDLAKEMRIPWVPLWTLGACSLSTHCYTNLIKETVGIHGIAGREIKILNFVPGFPELRLGDLPGGIIFGNLESSFSIMLHKMGQALPKATTVLINSFEELDPEINKDLISKFLKFFNVGPFNLISPPRLSNSDEYSCILWPDKRKPASMAYIGFGTVAKPTPHVLVALAEALEASTTPFLWSMEDKLKEHLPEGFLMRTSEQGKIVAWAPQVQILAHISTGVFITHCGWNSVLESIAAGVPMIGRPFLGDHHMNTWMVENVWKIGVRAEGGVFTKSGTMHALELVLSHERGRKLRPRLGTG